MDTTEKRFESDIESYLLSEGGYIKGDQKTYDKAKAIDMATLIRFKVRFLVKSFVRFYAYMAQIARTFDRDLFKTYIFCEYLYKLLPKTPHEKVDLSGKLTLEHHLFKVQPSGAIQLKPTTEEKTIKGEKGGKGKKEDEKRDLLDNIIDKINLMYQGNFTEADRVIVESIFDRLQGSGKTLAKQAKTTDVNMFAHNIFPKTFDKVAQKFGLLTLFFPFCFHLHPHLQVFFGRLVRPFAFWEIQRKS